MDHDISVEVSFITENVYLGSERAMYHDGFNDTNIRFIVRCMKGSVKCFNPDVEKFIFPMDDTGKSNLLTGVLPDAIPVLDSIYKRCVDENLCMFFHCSAGVNRSATLLTAWIMHYFKRNLKEAYSLVRKGRNKVCIHDLYMDQLRELDKSLFGEYSTTDGELLTTSLAMQIACDKWCSDELRQSSYRCGQPNSYGQQSSSSIELKCVDDIVYEDTDSDENSDVNEV